MTETWSLVVNILGLLATLCITWLIAQLGFHAARTSASRDSVVSDYALVEVPIRPARDRSCPEPVTFREWKQIVLNRRLELGTDPTSARSSWRLRSGIAARNADGSYTEENQVAFHVADRMQILGMAVFSGAVPPAYVIANLGDALVDDWLICEQWVASYREKELAQFEWAHPSSVDYHRRHAEWLAILAALHMDGVWHYRRAQHVLDFWGGREEAWKRLNLIWDLGKKDVTMVTGWYVRREVKRLAGRDWRNRARAPRTSRRVRRWPIGE